MKETCWKRVRLAMNTFKAPYSVYYVCAAPHALVADLLLACSSFRLHSAITPQFSSIYLNKFAVGPGWDVEGKKA